MAKVNLTSSTITVSELDFPHEGVVLKDTDGDPATENDRIHDRFFDFVPPILPQELAGRRACRGFSRSDIVLLRKQFDNHLKQAAGVLAEVNHHLKQSHDIHLNGFHNEVSFSFSQARQRRYRVGCQIGDDLLSCKQIEIDEFVLSNPNWDDPNPYYEVNTYVFGAETLANGTLPFADALKIMFNRWSDLLK